MGKAEKKEKATTEASSAREVYILMIGHRGELPDPFSSSQTFPYALGAVLGAFFSIEELKEFFLSLKSAAQSFLFDGASLEEAAHKNNLPVEVVKRVATVGGFVKYVLGLGEDYSVLKISGGTYVLEDIDALISEMDTFPSGVKA